MIFTTTINDKNVELKVVKPTFKQRQEAEKVKNTVFREALQGGAFLAEELNNVLRDRGYWDDEKEARLTELRNKITDATKKLDKGGFDFDEAVNLAFQVQQWRVEASQMLAVQAELGDKTAEGQSQNAYFDYLVSVCTVYNKDGKPVFSNYDDYLNNKNEPYAEEAGENLYRMLYKGVDLEQIAELPENRFLKEYGVVDDKLRRINEDGHLVDNEGRLVNEDGYYVNEKGERVDRNGNPLDKNGRPIIKRKPFTKNGKPVESKTEKEQVEDTAAKNDEPEKRPEVAAQSNT